MAELPRPIMLNVGRVAPEKNIEAFLELEAEGSKVVVGGGPALEKMKAAYPDVLFLGPKHGAELASVYTAADVFVFPSRTDTFGLVNIEALACGVPVAAFPVPGPADILGMNGYVLNGRVHPHITLSSGEHAFGGHLEPGTNVFTFALVTVGILSTDADFSRLDDQTYR